MDVENPAKHSTWLNVKAHLSWLIAQLQAALSSIPYYEVLPLAG